MAETWRHVVRRTLAAISVLEPPSEPLRPTDKGGHKVT